MEVSRRRRGEEEKRRRRGGEEEERRRRKGWKDGGRRGQEEGTSWNSEGALRTRTLNTKPRIIMTPYRIEV